MLVRSVMFSNSHLSDFPDPFLLYKILSRYAMPLLFTTLNPKSISICFHLWRRSCSSLVTSLSAFRASTMLRSTSSMLLPCVDTNAPTKLLRLRLSFSHASRAICSCFSAMTRFLSVCLLSNSYVSCSHDCNAGGGVQQWSTNSTSARDSSERSISISCFNCCTSKSELEDDSDGASLRRRSKSSFSVATFSCSKRARSNSWVGNEMRS